MRRSFVGYFMLGFLLFAKTWSFEMDSGNNFINLKIALDDVVLSDGKFDVKSECRTIRVQGLGSILEPGTPALPGISRMFSGSEPYCRYEIRDSFTIENIQIAPETFPEKIDNRSGSKSVNGNESYSMSKFPSSPVRVEKLYVYKGNTEWKINIVPFSYHHSEKRLTVYSDLSIYFSGKVLGKVMAAPESGGTREFPQSLIVTVDEFKQAADTLMLWHLMQGCKSEVVTAGSWTTNSIDSLIAERYSSEVTRPSYVTLIGDLNFIPSRQGIEDGDTFYTDLYYYCMDGDSDYMPDVASGRIPAVSNAQALQIVQKIKNFEMNPPSDNSFYTDFMACSYFQDNNPRDGYDDRSFAFTANAVVSHLDSLGYNGTRVFFTEENVSPVRWNDGTYGWGDKIPVYLQKPGFAWNGSQDDIIKREIGMAPGNIPWKYDRSRWIQSCSSGERENVVNSKRTGESRENR